MKKQFYILSLLLLFSQGLLWAKATPQVTMNSTQNQAHALRGWAVCMSEKWALVAAPKYDIDQVKNTGRVDIYAFNDEGWQLSQSLQSPRLQAHENFGHAVAIWDDEIFIAAPGNHQSGAFSGCVYVFKNDGKQWGYSQQLFPTTQMHGAMYGQAIAVNAKGLAIAAPKADGKVRHSGAVYFYTKNEDKWHYASTIVDDEGASNDLFGWRLCITDHLYITALRAKVEDKYTGKVCIYDLSSKAISHTVKPQQPQDHLCYGDGLAANENYLVVGAHKGIRADKLCGYVDVYSTEDYRLNQEIRAQEQANHSFFGKSVQLNNNELYIGEVKATSASNASSGVVHRYQMESHSFVWADNIVSNRVSEEANFGWSFDVNSQGLLIGEKGSDNNKNDAGNVYYFPNTSNKLQQSNADDKAIVISPNPWTKSLKVTAYLVTSAQVEVQISDANGRIIKREVKKDCPQGRFEYHWEISAAERQQLQPGAYFVQLKINDNIIVNKTLKI